MAIVIPILVVTGRRSLSVLVASEVMVLFDAVLNIIMSMILSGALTGAVQQGKRAARQKSKRVRRWHESSTEYQPDASEEWQAVVSDLAGRGFSLDALLDFYEGLGHDYMKHFSPSLSTTSDVVFGAIIPLSRSSRSAYAPIMMDGVPTQPDKPPGKRACGRLGLQ